MNLNFLLAFLVLLITDSKLQAQWHGDPAIVDNPIANSPANEVGVHCVTDGAGGAIYIFSASGVVLAQRKTSSGASVWSASANPVQVFNQGISFFDIQPDGKGGAYFSVQKYNSASSADVYVQYVTKDGKLPFGISGIKLNGAASNYCTDPKICATTNGLIVTWSDNIPQSSNGYFTYAQVFAQRFDSIGVPKWLAGGLTVSTVNSMHNVPEIVSDQHDGAFIAFTDYRNDTLAANNNLDVYAQHLDSAGKRVWGAADLVITNHQYNQTVYNNDYPVPAKSMIADSAGGFIIVYRSPDDDSMFAQRINPAGTLLFGSNGVSMSTDIHFYHAFMHLESDGSNGVVAGWAVYGNSGFLRAQRVSGQGALPWGSNGVSVNPSAVDDFNRVGIIMTADHTGNYIFGWPVQADQSFTYTGYRGQKINSAGSLQWAGTGIDIFTNPNASVYYPCMIYNSNQSVVTAWTDQRNYPANGTDIYGAKIGPDGTLVESAAIDFYTKADGNWNDPTIWTSGSVPPAGANVVIQNNIVANINATCNTLTLETSASLTINTGIHIIISH